MNEMTKVERIKAALKKEAVDKLPYAFWTHLPGDDMFPEIVAEKTYEFYKKYDLDFIKMMNNGMYAAEDFGCKSDSSAVKSGGATVLTCSPIQTADDWTRLEMPDIHKGAYGRELKHLRLLLEKTKGEVPVILTVYTPLAAANKIADSMLKYGSDNKTLCHILEGNGDKLKVGLEIITETTCNFIREAINMGADGVFIASQTSSYDYFTDKIYQEYGTPYDMKILEAAKGGWFNVLHAHGDKLMFDTLKDYPVDAFNWHAFETLPTLKQARDLTGKCLIGGIQRYSITNGNKNAIINEIYQSLEALKGLGHILTPGCVVRYPLNEDILAFVRKAKEEIEAKITY